MKKKIALATLATLIISGGYIAYKIFGPAVTAREKGPDYLYIKTGSDSDELKKELLEKKFISSPAWFDRVSRLLKFKNPKPGRYKLTDGMSLYQLVRKLRGGQQVPVNLVITKLRLREDLARRAGNLFECDSLQLIRFLNSNDSLKQFGADTNTVMSLALPLTYSISWNTNPKKILQHLHKAWTNYWTEERKQKADSLGLTQFQVSTLASIVDEETNKPSDRSNIASVYLNRISKGMPLQADPTVKFALKDFSIKRVLNKHLETISPYNTYLNTGLPPGPICTPQPETMDAILRAPKTDYLYFVASSKFDGTSVFTSDYADHMKYAREYQAALTRLLDSLKNK
jgi:UPF0755 protein